MKFYRLSIATLITGLCLNAVAANWSSVVTNDYGQYYYDSSNISGSLNDRKIITKANFLKDRPDKLRSMLVHYSIDCTSNTSLRELMKGYSELDLMGAETIIPVNLQKREEIKPNLIAKNYATIACSESSSTLASINTSRNEPQDHQKNKLYFFGKINPVKNLEDAFSNVMTEEQKTDIAWSFIFANNVHLKLTKGNDWRQQAVSYAPIIPIMKDGVDRYMRSFDMLSNKLGVSRASVMRELGIQINDFGLASFVLDKNFNIEAQMNMYIWYFEPQQNKNCSIFDVACQKNERESMLEKQNLQREMQPYYLQRPPNMLFGQTLIENVNNIDRVFQVVLGNASRIEARLTTQENDRLRREALYGDKELRNFLSNNWPHWDERTIDHAVKSESDKIRSLNPNYSAAEVNQAVKELWQKRADYKNNPSSRPDAKTLAAKRGFTGQLGTIDNESELSGACVAVARSFLSNARGTAFDIRGVGQWSSCVAQRNFSNSNFSSGLKKWMGEFSNTNPAILQLLMDQCAKNIVVSWDNSTGRCL